MRPCIGSGRSLMQAISTCLLGLVQRPIGAGEAVGKTLGVASSRESDAGGQSNRAGQASGSDRLQSRLQQVGGLILVAADHQPDELVAAEAGEHIAAARCTRRASTRTTIAYSPRLCP